MGTLAIGLYKNRDTRPRPPSLGLWSIHLVLPVFMNLAACRKVLFYARYGAETHRAIRSLPMPALEDSIRFVKGIGPKKAALLEKLHICTLRDALETYPRDYEDRTVLTRIADLGGDGKYAIRAIVGTEPKTSRIRKGLTAFRDSLLYVWQSGG